MMIDLDAVMEASRERGRVAGLLEVAEVIARLTRDTRTNGFLGNYLNAMEDVTAELKRLLEKAPESPADERDGGGSEAKPNAFRPAERRT